MEPIKNSKFKPILSNTMNPPSGGKITFFKKALFGHTLASWDEDMCLLSISEVSALYGDAVKHGFKLAKENPEMNELTVICKDEVITK